MVLYEYLDLIVLFDKVYQHFLFLLLILLLSLLDPPVLFL